MYQHPAGPHFYQSIFALLMSFLRESTGAVWLLVEIDAVKSNVFCSERGVYVHRRSKQLWLASQSEPRTWSLLRSVGCSMTLLALNCRGNAAAVPGLGHFSPAPEGRALPCGFGASAADQGAALCHSLALHTGEGSSWLVWLWSGLIVGKLKGLIS